MKSIMLTKKRIPLLIAFMLCVELLIYLWATWTTKFDRSNFFAIEPEFIFNKCARNSGRISSAIILVTLLMVGYYGLKVIYNDVKKKDAFRILITLFGVNHLIHLLFLLLTLKTNGVTLDPWEPLHIGGTIHGIITFVLIIIIPCILWTTKNLNKLLYFCIILHLLNVSCFIIKTFWGKIKPDHPAYHNQFGIFVITAGCLYILYRVFLENKRNSVGN